MTTASDRPTTPQELFTDAWQQYESAEERLTAGDVRDACGKAWNATRSAARGAGRAHGAQVNTSSQISGWIRNIGVERPEFRQMAREFGYRARYLHQEVCYDGRIDRNDIPVMIHETADFIRQAENLAGLQEATAQV